MHAHKFKKLIMKKFRAIIYLILFLGVATLVIYFLATFINSQLDKKPLDAANVNPTEQVAKQEDSKPVETTTATATSTTDQPSTEAVAIVTPVTSTEVSTTQPANSVDNFVTAIGTVKSSTSASLTTAISAAVKKVNFSEGDYVKAGDVIVELTGTNLAEHSSETQLKIAEATYNNAKASLANLEKTSNESLRTAELQLQSAIHQADAIPYDLAVIEQNQAGTSDALNILNKSLYTTRSKNDRDIYKTQTDIDDLIYTLNSAQDNRSQTQQKIDDLNDQADSPEKTAQFAKLQAALDAQSKGIEELYDAIDKAKYGYSTLLDAAQLGENQLLGQIAQSENQSKVLDLNLQSARTKLGFTGDTSDALQLAQQAYNATRIQLLTAIDNANNQLALSKLNVDLAHSQADGLHIKAPFSGIITKLDLTTGELVNNQTAIAELIDPKGYELEVGVSTDTLDHLDLTKSAQVELAGHIIEVPIKSISPKVDEKTKLVTIKLQLPNIMFKINQNLKAKLPLASGDLLPQSSAGNSVFFIPLDAVTIGSESEFVYINDNGKAKRVEIKLGEIAGDQVAVIGGLDPSAEIIVKGAKDLTDGQAITTVNQ